MNPFLEIVAGHPVREFAAGDYILRQDGPCDELYVLLEGEVEVMRDDVRVAKISESGSVFGEMSLLLGGPCTASVRALGAARVTTVYEPRAFLASSPVASLHIAELLAHRIDALNRYLVDVKHQYEGHDHIGMVDDVLSTLMHRQRKKKH
ncbi:cyclic nucleotide-binding domain-containing protein [Haloferula sp. BvORR071]|uniref:Crp/Fnr family transcriptional regulator n=1 Tax=Haloferula sp. BvORR071 TaxID=1396141 RepID=UPI000697C637|nr:cyclic nucleotide-binding domain-containing protein [Haloferula sp. BvORR071]